VSDIQFRVEISRRYKKVVGFSLLAEQGAVFGQYIKKLPNLILKNVVFVCLGNGYIEFQNKNDSRKNLKFICNSKQLNKLGYILESGTRNKTLDIVEIKKTKTGKFGFKVIRRSSRSFRRNSSRYRSRKSFRFQN
jgi:hypothetical protein